MYLAQMAANAKTSKQYSIRGGADDAESAEADFYGKASLLEVRAIEIGKRIRFSQGEP